MQLIVYLEMIALFMEDVDAIWSGHFYRTQIQLLIGSLADVCRTLVYIFMKMANVPIMCFILNHFKNIRCAHFTFKVFGT